MISSAAAAVGASRSSRAAQQLLARLAGGRANFPQPLQSRCWLSEHQRRRSSYSVAAGAGARLFEKQEFPSTPSSSSSSEPPPDSPDRGEEHSEGKDSGGDSHAQGPPEDKWEHGASDSRPTPSSGLARRVERYPISEDVKQSLYGMGVTKLTEIQARAFNPIVRGRNFLGRSHTGSGKTIAYMLPIIERMRHQKINSPHSVLILVPSRELAQQVGGTLLSLSVGIDIGLVYSGVPIGPQEAMVRLGPKVVVGTPGRVAQLISKGTLQPKNFRILVVDEVDSLLGVEFRGRTERVLAAAATAQAQTILFSASMSPEVMTLIRRHFTTFDIVDLIDRGGIRGKAAVQSVEHILCKVPPGSGNRVVDGSRIRVLLHLLDSRLSLQPEARCIIFTESAAEAKVLLSHPALNRRAKAIHSDSSDKDRDVVLTAFSNREFDVLVATDIVSRGIDFADVALILQLSPPRDAQRYVHRAGRTGRGGNGGTVITLYEPSEYPHVHRIRELTRQKFKIEATPGPNEIHHAAVSRILDDLLSVRQEELEPFISDAEKLLGQHGGQVLATTMAVLDARHADLRATAEEAPSLLTGRQGFICLLAHDPDHDLVTGASQLRSILSSFLPASSIRLFKGAANAAEALIGKISRTTDGWAADVDRKTAMAMVESVRSGRKSSPFELIVARELPRLTRAPLASRAARRLPWTARRVEQLKAQSAISRKRRTATERAAMIRK